MEDCKNYVQGVEEAEAEDVTCVRTVLAGVALFSVVQTAHGVATCLFVTYFSFQYLATEIKGVQGRLGVSWLLLQYLFLVVVGWLTHKAVTDDGRGDSGRVLGLRRGVLLQVALALQVLWFCHASVVGPNTAVIAIVATQGLVQGAGISLRLSLPVLSLVGLASGALLLALFAALHRLGRGFYRLPDSDISTGSQERCGLLEPLLAEAATV